MAPVARIGVAGIGLASPLGNDPASSWERLVAGHGAVGRVSFDGLPDIAAAQVAGDVSTVLGRLQQVGTERVSQLALGAVRRALAAAAATATVRAGLPRTRISRSLRRCPVASKRVPRPAASSIPTSSIARQRFVTVVLRRWCLMRCAAAIETPGLHRV